MRVYWKCIGAVKGVYLRRGVVIITTAQLHSTTPEPRFDAVSNPAHGVQEVWMVRISDSSPGRK